MKDNRIIKTIISREIVIKMVERMKSLYGTFTCVGFLTGNRENYAASLESVTVLDVEVPMQTGTLCTTEIAPEYTAMFIETLKKYGKLEDFIGLVLYNGNRDNLSSEIFAESLENLRELLDQPFIGLLLNDKKKCTVLVRDKNTWYEKEELTF